ncbi:Cytoskeleton associated protein 5 [Sparganum proliferum]
MSKPLELLDSRNWQDRKTALQLIGKRLQSPSCPPLEITDLVTAVIELLSKEKHTHIVVAAANLLAQSASFLDQQFTPFARPALEACLTGLQSCKPIVLTALRAAANATISNLPLEALVDIVTQRFKPKSNGGSGITGGNAAAELTNFLGRALVQKRRSGSAPTLLAARRAFLPRLMPLLSSLMDARSQDAREAACTALASLRLFVDDEACFNSAANDIGDAKLLRVREAYQRLLKEPEADAQEGEGGGGDLAVPQNPTTSSSTQRENGPPAKVRKTNQPPRLTAAKQENAQESSQPPPGGARKQSDAVTTAPSRSRPRPMTDVGPLISEQSLPFEEFKGLLTSHAHETVISRVKSGVWRERLSGMDDLLAAASSFDTSSPAFTQSLIRWLLEPPGLKDSNIQVRCRLFETLGVLLSGVRQPSLCASLVETLIVGATDGMAETKQVKSCSDCLDGLTKAISLDIVAESILRRVDSMKVPKSVLHALGWLTGAIDKSVTRFDRKLVVECLKTGFQSRDGGVRQAFITLAGSIYESLDCDPILRQQLDPGRTALSSLLDGEFKQRDQAFLAKQRQPDSLADHFEERIENPSDRTRIAASMNAAGRSSRRVTTNLEKPSNVLLESVHLSRVEEKTSLSTEDSENEACQTFQLASPAVPIMNNDPEAKQCRLQLYSGPLPREQLREAFLAAGMQPNFVRHLTAWECPGKLEKALQALKHSLLHPVPPRGGAKNYLADTISNLDLIFNWLSEAFFSQGSQIVTAELLNEAFGYLEEVVAHLQDANISLSVPEVAVLLPWPLLADPMARFFAVSTEQCKRLANLLRALCNIFPSAQIFSALMEGVASVTSSKLLCELISLASGLMTRFASVIRPSAAEIKSIVQHLGSADPDVRRAALEGCQAATGVYTPEQISAMAGKLTDRDRSLLEDCFRRAAPSSAAMGSSLTGDYTTPKRHLAPGEQHISFSNAPSILRSVSRSHLNLSVPPTTAEENSDEMIVQAERKPILKVLQTGSEHDCCSMIESLVSGLLTAAPSSEFDIGQVFFSMSHLEFINQTVVTRDHLLPHAPNIITRLGLQLSLVALGIIPQLRLRAEDFALFIRATCGCAIQLFKSSFVTRQLPPNALAHLIAGLIRLHSVFDRLSMGSFVADGSCLSEFRSLESSKSIREDVFCTLNYVHTKLCAENTASYATALLKLLDTSWDGFDMKGKQEDPLKSTAHLHLQCLQQVLERLEKESVEGSDFTQLLLAMAKLFPFEVEALPNTEKKDVWSDALRRGLRMAGMTSYRFCLSKKTHLQAFIEKSPEARSCYQGFFAWIQPLVG